MNEFILSALVGLVGACGNSGKSEHTDSIVMNALLHCYSSSDESEILNAIEKEKFTISPNCATCHNPCGNTSNYDMKKFHQNSDLKDVKEELIREIFALSIRLHNASKTELPEEIYKAISFFSYELSIDSYKELIKTIKQIKIL